MRHLKKMTAQETTEKKNSNTSTLFDTMPSDPINSTVPV
jgi:hypothetical protein